MGRIYRTRTFKSGDAVALELPAELGLAPGDEVVVREEASGFAIERAAAPAKPGELFDVDAIWGIAPGAVPLSSEDRAFDERPSARAGDRAG
jgi:antitoxin VapB